MSSVCVFVRCTALPPYGTAVLLPLMQTAGFKSLTYSSHAPQLSVLLCALLQCFAFVLPNQMVFQHVAVLCLCGLHCEPVGARGTHAAHQGWCGARQPAQGATKEEGGFTRKMWPVSYLILDCLLMETRVGGRNQGGRACKAERLCGS